MKLVTLKEIGHRIKTRREELKFSEKNLSEYLGISIPEYQQIETGERSVSLEEVQAFCLLFHVSADYLIPGQLGLLECYEMIKTVQETPEPYRDVSVAMTVHIENVAFGKEPLLTAKK